MKTDKKPLSIYIHIPFCVKKCNYCDFLSSPQPVCVQQRYLRALAEEIRRSAHELAGYRVETIFIGGGTPSVPDATELAEVLETLFQVVQVAEDAEISIEVNPGTVDEEKLRIYREVGINRLSIGLQSADDGELACLGRIHSYENFLDTYGQAVKSGFTNINVDLMSAIPGQTMDSYVHTLEKVLSLEPAPAHISAYSLIIEEGTPFYEGVEGLPDEDTEREMYQITDVILKRHDYYRYEISNYAKVGYECRHNIVYWTRGEYLGFGIGAASLFQGKRFHNTCDINKYIEIYLTETDTLRAALLKADGINTGGLNTDGEFACAAANCREDVEILTAEDAMEEFMFLGLRLTRGVSLQEFENSFQKRVQDVYPGVLEKLEDDGLITLATDAGTGETQMSLTAFGLDVSNRVMAEFLLKSGS